MAFKGAWIAGYGYAANDVVTYGIPASTYLALISNTSQDPVDFPGVWAVLAQGSAGPSGPTGAAATVSVDPTVITGLPGTNASVINTGTSTAAVLQFTIPQGAAGAPGSGGSGGGGGTSGIPFVSVYHTVSLNYIYYSTNNSNSNANELAPHTALTWMPASCTATQLNVYSQQTQPISVTLRVGTLGSLADTALTCMASPGSSCTASGSIAIPQGSFVDFSINGANSTPAPVWTALACN